ncbi:KilA-N domain-containing protein [Weissella cibaria]|uniref:KilA-N domain-containing protein n=1 Tax=Weissella cibaria TaxID=137591 RepID=UPI001C1F7483|nr:KilA-N domain-containing protein [Weissella cibaria]MBU7544293.1 KilA-N domain-containing protein [Weissella cibaria]MCV3317423.1 KilA-N domain-containing protein [Weissella cibaria]
MVNKETLSASGVPITIINEGSSNSADYMSLTDIAKSKNADAPADVIKNWLRSKQTIEFMGVWEQLNNPSFNLQNFAEFRNEAGANAFVMSPKKWIDDTNSIGLISRSGRYGGTYAHIDIAFEFAAWISPEFRLYLYKDYQQLKTSETNKLNIDWNLNRELSRLNYQLQTDAVKEHLIPNAELQKQYGWKYADEADRINVAVFGMTAKEWRDSHPNSQKSENIRDYATKVQLLVLSNLQVLNADMITSGMDESSRSEKLNTVARDQLARFSKSEERLQRIESENKSDNQPFLN